MKRYRILQVIHDEISLEESTAPDAMTMDEVTVWATERGMLPSAEEMRRWLALTEIKQGTSL